MDKESYKCMEKYFCTGRDCKMNKIFEELINELNQSISENENWLILLMKRGYGVSWISSRGL